LAANVPNPEEKKNNTNNNKETKIKSQKIVVNS
jgi:hypothetical protein